MPDKIITQQQIIPGGTFVPILIQFDLIAKRASATAQSGNNPDSIIADLGNDRRLQVPLSDSDIKTITGIFLTNLKVLYPDITIV